MRNQFADVLVDEIKRNRAEDGHWFMEALFTATASTLSEGTQEEKCGYVGKWLLHVVWGSMAMWVLLNLCVVATACSALGCASEVAKVGVAPSAASSRAYLRVVRRVIVDIRGEMLRRQWPRHCDRRPPARVEEMTMNSRVLASVH